MAKIKKAQSGGNWLRNSCGWSRGERTSLGERLRNLKTSIEEARASRQYKREDKRAAKAAARKPAPSKEGGYERDFPADVTPGGFKGDPGGKKGTRWADGGSPKMVGGGLKRGGKIKKAQTGVKATRITEMPNYPSTRRRIDYSVDTAGYAAGKKSFPATKKTTTREGTTEKKLTVGRGKVKSFIKKPLMSRVNVPKKKLGGKLAKQAAIAISMKKKGIKPKKSK